MYLALILAVLRLLGGTPELFRPLDLDAAVLAARQERKAVLVVFGSAASADTKRLDTSTWNEAKMREWIGRKAVAIKVDVEQQVELARRFRVHVLPTIVFLNAQGIELDRLTGFVDGRVLRPEAELILAGADSVARLQKKLVGHENDPQLRVDLAGAYFDHGLLKESCDEYLWCWDHGVESDPSFEATRADFLLREIQRLGRVYTPASDALQERARHLFDRLTGCNASDREVKDFVAIYQTTEREDKILEAFDQMQPDVELCKAMRARLGPYITDALIDARRYTEAVELLGDVKANLEARIARYQADVARLQADKSLDFSARIETRLKALRVEMARLYEALLGAHEYDPADVVAVRICEFDHKGAEYVALIRGALRAEAHGAAKSIATRALSDTKLSDAEKAEVKKAAVGIVQPK
jgi:hypothetical protein